MVQSIDGEKVKELKGYKMEEGSILISDGVLVGKEEVRVIIEPSLIKFWIEECGLLDELNINATLW